MAPSNESPVSIVLGATGAIGGALTRLLIASGHRVIAAGRDNAKLRALATEENCDVRRVDATRPGSIEDCISEVAERLGRVDAIANCIGSMVLKPAHLTSDSELDAMLRTNLHSSFEVVRGAARAMRATGGSVVLVSSAAARIGIANHEAIAAAKAAVEGLALAAAATYAHQALRFNVVAPGLVRSPMTQAIWKNEAAASASVAMHALGRLGEPQDVASLIAWLVNPAHAWMTGQVVGIDGGLAGVLPRQRRATASR